MDKLHDIIQEQYAKWQVTDTYPHTVKELVESIKDRIRKEMSINSD